MTDPAVYCLACGRVAAEPTRSMDPAHPIVLCRELVIVNGRDQVRGCGRQPGTFDPGEAARVIANRRAIQARKDHQAGKHAKRPVHDCDRCAGAIEHRRHVESRHMVEGCALCTLARERTTPARHAG